MDKGINLFLWAFGTFCFVGIPLLAGSAYMEDSLAIREQAAIRSIYQPIADELVVEMAAGHSIDKDDHRVKAVYSLYMEACMMYNPFLCDGRDVIHRMQRQAGDLAMQQ